MALSISQLRSAGWADPNQAEKLVETLAEAGVSQHYAELALRKGPDAVAHLVAHRGEKDALWAERARSLVAGGAGPQWQAPHVGDPKGSTLNFRAGLTGCSRAEGSEPVRFYDQDEAYGEFSNFSPFPFSVSLEDGTSLDAPTSEHFFQALKFWTTDRAYALEILSADKPKAAADMGRNRDKPMRSDWEDIKDDVMRVALAHKVGQNPKLKALLLGTGDAPLVEHAPLDGYWGNAYELGGDGQNMLGRMLEEVRAALRGGTFDSHVVQALRGAKLRS